MSERKIIHVDMDAFFASVEIRDNTSLKGKPLIIGAKPQERGVVSTCSYEARRFGVKSGMSIKTAYKLCPQGVYMHPDIRKYEKVSEELRKIFYRYSFKIEPASLDEAYLDVSQTADLFSGE
ncbi:MAG TPA: DNA polymerase IV, partial [Petrotogaceae bacterium]|nr:DNA polymerase IV [Petrotogaceae bacterium]